jgi:serine protease Do
MRTRTLTMASFFSVAMAATLLGALLTTQVRRPEVAQASSVASTPQATAPRVAPSVGGGLGLETFRDIAKALNDGVVNINTSKVIKLPRFRDPFHDFFGDDPMERFFGPSPDEGGRGERRSRQTSLGSGFVIDKDGYILTNRHVVEGADEISVTFPGGRHYDAVIKGKDARTDVALIKIEPKEPLTVLPLGDSDRVDVGEWVMAVGNPFGLGGNSVTVGVVSFKGRDLVLGVRGTSVDMLQTDAAINPGNSGGPLLDTRGEVIGINTMIVTDGVSRANAGVGFSVPINVAKGILDQLREKGRVDRGWMGVTIQAVTEDLAKTYGLEEARGAIVSSVTPGSPAEKAGLKAEDVILSADGRKVEDNGDLSRYIASRAPGTTVKLEVRRNGESKSISLTLGTFPDDPNEVAGEDEGKARLGMTLRDLTPEIAERLGLPRGSTGAVVTDVEGGEPAEDAGLQRGDVIVSVNGQAIDGVAAFEKAVDAARDDGLARLRVVGAGGARIVVLKFK